MRRIYLIIIVLIFIIGIQHKTPIIGRAEASDIKGTKYEQSVDSLNSLGVLKGYPDGTFKPDNTISRAEFAAVAVRLLNLEEAARVTKGLTVFSDMQGYEWASGYVNVAAQQGIILGYPDGTFKPSKPVTEAEALTILVRVLGYEPVVNKEEGWPTNYINKAIELGLTEGINIVANKSATRGKVALFTEKALYIDKMVQSRNSTDGIEYIIDQDNMIINSNLKAHKYTGIITDTYVLLDSDLHINEFELTTETDKLILKYDSLNYLYGKNVSVWASKDKEVIQLTVDDPILEDTVELVDDNKITLKEANTSLLISEDAKLLFNYSKNKDITKYQGLKVKYVINEDNEITYLEGVNYDKSLNQIMVDSIDGEIIKNKIGLDLYLEGKSYNIDLSKLNEFDLVYIFSNSNSSKYYLDVISDSVTGKINSYSNSKLTINNINYEINPNNFFLSLDYGKTKSYEARLFDYLGKNVTAVLDANGKVIFLYESVFLLDQTNYMVIKDYDIVNSLETKYYLKVQNQDNTELWYELTDYTEFYDSNGVVNNNVNIGEADSIDAFFNVNDTGKGELRNDNPDFSNMIADIQLNADGTIAKVRLPLGSTYNVNVNLSTLNRDRKLMFTPTGPKPISSDAIFYDINNNRFILWDEFSSLRIRENLISDIIVSDGKVIAFKVISGSITSGLIDGIILEAYINGDEELIIKLNEAGIISYFEVDTRIFPNPYELDAFVHDYVVLTIENGKVNTITSKINSEETGLLVKSIGYLSIIINNGSTDTVCYLEDDVNIYDVSIDEPDLISIDEIQRGNRILFYDLDNNQLYDVVLIVE